MRIAIVGAGYAGLAAAFYLQEFDVTVFDCGGGASSASTGLLHPYPGREAKLNWRAHEGMAASLELLQIAGRETYVQNGLIRYAITSEQPPVKQIPEGITVFSRLYLQGLRRACARVRFIDAKASPADLANFDVIILAAGANTKEWPVCRHLNLQTTIGQSLLCRWPEPIPHSLLVPHSLLALGHIVPTEDPALCQVGSTYEHTPKPDPKKALALLTQVAHFYPPAKDFQILEIRSGIRIAPKVGYRPIVEKVDPKTWVFTGLGSRGLLYHALLAKELAAEIKCLQ